MPPPASADDPTLETAAATTDAQAPVDIPDKVYFRIGEVAKLVGVKPHVIRFWQEQFPSVRPERSRSGRFLYPRKAVERLLRIKHLLYQKGYTIPGARKALRRGEGLVAGQEPTAGKPDDEAAQINVDTLQARIAELEDELAALRRDRESLKRREKQGGLFEDESASEAAAAAARDAQTITELRSRVDELEAAAGQAAESEGRLAELKAALDDADGQADAARAARRTALDRAEAMLMRIQAARGAATES